jgi:hypothetical protein
VDVNEKYPMSITIPVSFAYLESIKNKEKLKMIVIVEINA